MEKIILGLEIAILCTLLPVLATAQTLERKSDQEQRAYYSADQRTVKCKEAYQKRKYKKAYKKCLPAAEDGNLLAMVNLGFIKKKGVGEKSTEYWFKKAAEQGYPDAQYRYGDLREGANGLMWKIKAAEAGHSIAQMALGERYEKGDIVKRDYKKAAYWYERSAAQDVPYAAGRLKLIYSNGQAKKSDATKAAAKILSTEDVSNYLYSLQINENWVEPGDTKSEELYQHGMNIYKEWDFGFNKSFDVTRLDEVMTFFKQASARGNAKAFYKQGVVHWSMNSDDDLERVGQEASALYIESAKLGYLEAQLEIASKYIRGKDITKSYSQGAYWYLQAARQGSEKAKDNLNYLLVSGAVNFDDIPNTSIAASHKMTKEESFFAGLEAGYKKNFSKAEALLIQASKEGHVGAQSALGRMYYDGEGVPRSLELAYKWYKAAGLAGNTQSQYMMGHIWHHDQARAGAHQEGLVGKFYPDRIETARWWYEKAAPYDERAKQQLQALSSYTTPPPPPEPKRGWFEQMAVDAYARSQQPRVYNTPVTPTPETCGAWRCYKVGNGKEQCFRDCG